MSDKIDINKQNIVNNTEQSKIIDNTNEVLKNQSTPEYQKIENNKVPTSPTAKGTNYLSEDKDIPTFETIEIYEKPFDFANYKNDEKLKTEYGEEYRKHINKINDLKNKIKQTSGEEKDKYKKELLELEKLKYMNSYNSYVQYKYDKEKEMYDKKKNNYGVSIITGDVGDDISNINNKDGLQIQETPKQQQEKDDKTENSLPAGSPSKTIEKETIRDTDVKYKDALSAMKEFDQRNALTDEGVTLGEVALGGFGDNIKKVKNKQADINKTRDEALDYHSKTEDSKNAENSKSEYQKEKETRKRLKKVLALQTKRKNLEKMLENTPPIKEYINGKWVDRGKRPKIFNKIKDDIDKIDSELNTDYSDLKDFTIEQLNDNIKNNFKEKNDAWATMVKMESKFKGNENKIKFAALSHSEYLVNDLAKKGLISPEQQEEMIKDIKEYKELKKPLNVQGAKLAFLIVDAFRKTIMNIARAMPKTQYSANLGEMETPAIESIINTAISNTQDAIHQAQTNVLDVGKEKQFKEMELRLKWAENQWLKDQKQYNTYYDNLIKNNEEFYSQLSKEFDYDIEKLKQKLPYEIVVWVGNAINNMSDDAARNFVKGILGSQLVTEEGKQSFINLMVGLTDVQRKRLENILDFSFRDGEKE